MEQTRETMAAGSAEKGLGHLPRVGEASLEELVRTSGRAIVDTRQFDLLRPVGATAAQVYFAGDLQLLQTPSVSVVGTRDVSEDGRRRAAKLSRELARAGVTVVSGLARGVDTAAHVSAIEAGGRTVAVIGTPLDKAYPTENRALQTAIAESHLLLSPFARDEKVFRSNFPKRNRVMALLSDATVIIEASDTSGTLHQAAECLRQGRWLFIARSVVQDPTITWPKRFIGHERVLVLTATNDVLTRVLK
jgi:DNA processing protein